MTVHIHLRNRDVEIVGTYTPAQPDTRPTIDGPGEPGWPAEFVVESAPFELTADELAQVIDACATRPRLDGLLGLGVGEGHLL